MRRGEVSTTQRVGLNFVIRFGVPLGLLVAGLCGGATVVELPAQDTGRGPAGPPRLAPIAGEGDGESEGLSGPLWSEPGHCDACHVEADWWIILEPAARYEFDHSETGFELKDGHSGLECKDCHRRGLASLSNACTTCHRDPHARFNTIACEECHNVRTWDVPRNFPFHERTRFPLTGAHATIQCEACHRNRRGEPAALISTECIVCHAVQYRAAVPNHIAAGFTQCGFCHSTDRFRGATYVHQTYQLLGRHALVRDCEDCHTGAVFDGLAQNGTQCITCHADDYARTATLGGAGVPNHPANANLFPPNACNTAGCHGPSEASGTWDLNGNPAGP